MNANESELEPSPRDSLSPDDEDDAGGGGNVVDIGGAWLRYKRRSHKDDTLYIVLGVVVGSLLVGVFVTLFVCARRQRKQRLVLGTTVELLLWH